MPIERGTPGQFPSIYIGDERLSQSPLFVIHGAGLIDLSGARFGTIARKFDDLRDDEHDRCTEIELQVAGFSPKWLDERGMMAEAVLIRTFYYTPDMTPEKWLAEARPSSHDVITDCDPATCDYGYEEPHRIGGRYSPPEQEIILPYRGKGPAPVSLMFRWNNEGDE